MDKHKPKEQPSFYAIIPAHVRYDNELSEFQKLLYSEITALADKAGYCRAGNTYFARLYHKDKTRISKCITWLEKKGYIQCIIERNTGTVRKIFITGLRQNPVAENNNTPGLKLQEGIAENSNGPLAQNCNHNNTSITSTSRSSKKAAPPVEEILNADDAYLTVRNTVTGKTEVINGHIRKELQSLSTVSIAAFTTLVEKYKTVVGQIREKMLQKYLYYPVRNYDFVQFIKKMNRFCTPTNPAEIILKLAKKNELKAVERILQPGNEQRWTPQHTVHTVDKNLAKAALQKAAAALKTRRQKQNLSDHFLQPWQN
jgi:SOS-response transcriptional repressor LexA